MEKNPVAMITIMALFFAVMSVSSATHHLTLQRRKMQPSEHVKMDRARQLARFSKGTVNFPLEGCVSKGLYTTVVKLGNPPQEFVVEVDTATDNFWVACSTCDMCLEIEGLSSEFDISKSSTAKAISCSSKPEECTFNLRYLGGKVVSGFNLEDMIHFMIHPNGSSNHANSSAQLVQFGCATNVSDNVFSLYSPTDGIIGFGPGRLSVISQLSARGVTPKVFYHCLRDDGNGGGSMGTGKVSEPEMNHSPLVRSHHGGYNLNLQSIDMDGTTLVDPSLLGESAGIDSGTTYAYLPPAAHSALLAGITKKVVSPTVTPTIVEGFNCFMLTDRLVTVDKIFPTLRLNFKGFNATIVLEPGQYLFYQNFEYSPEDIWCLGFLVSPLSDYTLLGDIVLKDKVLEYDAENQIIRWISKNCSFPVKTSIPRGMSVARQDPNILLEVLCILGLVLLV